MLSVFLIVPEESADPYETIECLCYYLLRVPLDYSIATFPPLILGTRLKVAGQD